MSSPPCSGLAPASSQFVPDLRPPRFLSRAVLTAITAPQNGPWCVYIANGNAGHAIGMVYNGIEYSIMQLIPAAYEIAKVFAAFHKTGLNSYLFAANGWCEKAKMEEK